MVVEGLVIHGMASGILIEIHRPMSVIIVIATRNSTLKARIAVMPLTA